MNVEGQLEAIKSLLYDTKAPESEALKDDEFSKSMLEISPHLKKYISLNYINFPLACFLVHSLMLKTSFEGQEKSDRVLIP